MKLTIDIEMDNAAFEHEDEAGNPVEGYANGTEVARILKELAEKVDDMPLAAGTKLVIRDINGNSVGSATVTE